METNDQQDQSATSRIRVSGVPLMSSAFEDISNLISSPQVLQNATLASKLGVGGRSQQKKEKSFQLSLKPSFNFRPKEQAERAEKVEEAQPVGESQAVQKKPKGKLAEILRDLEDSPMRPASNRLGSLVGNPNHFKSTGAENQNPIHASQGVTRKDLALAKQGSSSSHQEHDELNILMCSEEQLFCEPSVPAGLPEDEAIMFSSPLKQTAPEYKGTENLATSYGKENPSAALLFLGDTEKGLKDADDDSITPADIFRMNQQSAMASQFESVTNNEGPLATNDRALLETMKDDHMCHINASLEDLDQEEMANLKMAMGSPFDVVQTDHMHGDHQEQLLPDLFYRQDNQRTNPHQESAEVQESSDERMAEPKDQEASEAEAAEAEETTQEKAADLQQQIDQLHLDLKAAKKQKKIEEKKRATLKHQRITPHQFPIQTSSHSSSYAAMKNLQSLKPRKTKGPKRSSSSKASSKSKKSATSRSRNPKLVKVQTTRLKNGQANFAANKPYRSQSAQALIKVNQLGKSSQSTTNSKMTSGGISSRMTSGSRQEPLSSQGTGLKMTSGEQKACKGREPQGTSEYKSFLESTVLRAGEKREVQPTCQVLNQDPPEFDPGASLREVQMALINNLVLEDSEGGGTQDSAAHRREPNKLTASDLKQPLGESMHLLRQQSKKFSAGTVNHALNLNLQIQTNSIIQKCSRQPSNSGSTQQKKKNGDDSEILPQCPEQNLSSSEESRSCSRMEAEQIVSRQLKSPVQEKPLVKITCVDLESLLNDALGPPQAANVIDSRVNPLSIPDDDDDCHRGRRESLQSEEEDKIKTAAGRNLPNDDCTPLIDRASDDHDLKKDSRPKLDTLALDQANHGILSASEGLTDLGESPLLQLQRTQGQMTDRSHVPNFIGPIPLRRHHYDPHEPHSAFINNYQTHNDAGAESRNAEPIGEPPICQSIGRTLHRRQHLLDSITPLPNNEEEPEPASPMKQEHLKQRLETDHSGQGDEEGPNNDDAGFFKTTKGLPEEANDEPNAVNGNLNYLQLLQDMVGDVGEPEGFSRQPNAIGHGESKEGAGSSLIQLKVLDQTDALSENKAQKQEGHHQSSYLVAGAASPQNEADLVADDYFLNLGSSAPPDQDGGKLPVPDQPYEFQRESMPEISSPDPNCKQIPFEAQEMPSSIHPPGQPEEDTPIGEELHATEDLVEPPLGAPSIFSEPVLDFTQKPSQPDVNAMIANDICQNYFPEHTKNYEILQGMLAKEAKIQEKKQEQEEARESMLRRSMFEKQSELTPDMRLMLHDWLCHVSSDYCLKRQTFHMAVACCDAYLERCPHHIPTSEFQLIGVTCLFMAAKIEEIYPPHISSFSEATNESVTSQQIIAQEYKICQLLDWNFDQFESPLAWLMWYTRRWDSFVDANLGYLKEKLSLKFWEPGRDNFLKFQTAAQFMDAFTLSYSAKEFQPRTLIAALLYLVIGGKDMLKAFNVDYEELPRHLQGASPVKDPQDMQTLFLNQLIQSFFVNEFAYNLEDLAEPISFVLNFMKLEIKDAIQPQDGLMQQCKYVLAQYQQIALEKIIPVEQQRDQTEMEDNDVFKNTGEFYSYQTYNPNMLETVKQTDNEVRSEQMKKLWQH